MENVRVFSLVPVLKLCEVNKLFVTSLKVIRLKGTGVLKGLVINLLLSIRMFIRFLKSGVFRLEVEIREGVDAPKAVQAEKLFLRKRCFFFLEKFEVFKYLYNANLNLGRNCPVTVPIGNGLRVPVNGNKVVNKLVNVGKTWFDMNL